MFPGAQTQRERYKRDITFLTRRKKADNVMPKRKRETIRKKRHTTVNKTQHMELKTEQQDPNQKPGLIICALQG